MSDYTRAKLRQNWSTRSRSPLPNDLMIKMGLGAGEKEHSYFPFSRVACVEVFGKVVRGHEGQPQTWNLETVQLPHPPLYLTPE
jgi:hypothetical protein